MKLSAILCSASNAASIVLTGDYGQFLTCPYGYIMDGYCSSGNKKDCDYNSKSYSHLIRCTENTRFTLDFAPQCYWVYGDFEQSAQCATDEIATGACSSGSNDDCNKYASAVQCCHFLTNHVNNGCSWQYPSGYGTFSYCPMDEYAAGVCTVGRWGSEVCGSSGKSGLKCCPIVS